MGKRLSPCGHRSRLAHLNLADHNDDPARLQRAIGVIYRPQTERQSHYLRARVADQYDAVTFERWNIVNRIVPDDAFESQTRAFAERLASGPTLAYAAGKRIVRAYLDDALEFGKVETHPTLYWPLSRMSS